jgi:ABC-type transport system involved in multi-copper enzyme maturation permease subunit
MFGPLYYYELVRLARKGHSVAVRCGYALVLFATLFFVYRDYFPHYDLLLDPFAVETAERYRLAGLASEFVTAVLMAQTVAILVLTPAYLAGAIVGERERGSLDVLLTTHLTDREVVLGKLAVAVTHLGDVFLAALPLLALMQLWGGVDFTALLAAFAAAGLNLLAVGSLSVFWSATTRTTGEALIAAYLCVFLYLVAVWVLLIVSVETRYPLAMTGQGVFLQMTAAYPAVSATATRTVPLASCAAFNGTLTAIFLLAAVTCLRSVDTRVKRRKAAPPAVPAPAKAKPSRNFPPVSDRPLLWKEANAKGNLFSPSLEWFLARFWPVLLVLAAGVNRFFPATRLFWARVNPMTEHYELVVFCFAPFLGFALIWCIDVAFRSAACVCREREGRTLDVLLSLPVSRAAVLGAKWLGTILTSRAGYGVVLAVALNLAVGKFPLQDAVLLLCVLAAQVAFLAGLGLRISVTARSTLRARVTMAVALLLFFRGAWFLSTLDVRATAAVSDARELVLEGKPVPLTRPGLVRGLVYDVGANPVRSWFALLRVRAEEGHTRDHRNELLLEHPFNTARQVMIAAATLVYALAAVVLFLDACRCLRAEQRGRPDHARVERGD